MTNWDKINTGIEGLFAKDFKDSEFASIIANSGDCDRCGIGKFCDEMMYEHDENGNIILDEDKYAVFKECNPGCKNVILAWLRKESEED